MSVSNFRANLRVGTICASLLAAAAVSVLGQYESNRTQEGNVSGIRMFSLVDQCYDKAAGTNKCMTIEASQEMARGVGYTNALKKKDFFGLIYGGALDGQSIRDGFPVSPFIISGRKLILSGHQVSESDMLKYLGGAQ